MNAEFNRKDLELFGEKKKKDMRNCLKGNKIHCKRASL